MAEVSIVLTHWNRKKQLFNTLRSIWSYDYNFEIIIVDDASTDGSDIGCYNYHNMKVIKLKNKTWINPCIAFNTGFAEATGDIIIIQNAECMHVGDIIGHAIKNARKGLYLSYGAFCLNEALTTQLIDCINPDALIEPYKHNKIDTEVWDGNGWYNHSVYRPLAYHFCTAMMREDLYDLGGFDERYADGLGMDDNELLERVHKKGMHIEFVDYPYVIHQHHPKFQPGDVTSLMAINGLKLEETRKSHSYDVKPFNTIYK